MDRFKSFFEQPMLNNFFNHNFRKMHPDTGQEYKRKLSRRTRSIEVDIDVTTALLMANYNNINIENEKEELLNDFEVKETKEFRKSFIFETLNRRTCYRRESGEETVLYVNKENGASLMDTLVHNDKLGLADKTSLIS